MSDAPVREPAARHRSLAEALENRRHLAKKRRNAAFELSTATGFRGAEACLQRERCLAAGSRTGASDSTNLWNSTRQAQDILVYLIRMNKIGQ